MKKRERIDKKKLLKAIEAAKKQPRLAFYSPLAASVFNYWKNTLPRYSISEEIAKIIELEIRKRWPELWKLAAEYMKQRQR